MYIFSKKRNSLHQLAVLKPVYVHHQTANLREVGYLLE